MSIETGWLIEVDGAARRIDLDTTSSHTRLQVLYREIGCSTVDMVALTPTVDVWVDDEGMFNSQPNLLGSVLVEQFAGRRMRQMLFGNLVFLSRRADDACGLSSADLAKLEELTGKVVRELGAWAPKGATS